MYCKCILYTVLDPVILEMDNLQPMPSISTSPTTRSQVHRLALYFIITSTASFITNFLKSARNACRHTLELRLLVANCDNILTNCEQYNNVLIKLCITVYSVTRKTKSSGMSL